jgi:hypothetical protein
MQSPSLLLVHSGSSSRLQLHSNQFATISTTRALVLASSYTWDGEWGGCEVPAVYIMKCGTDWLGVLGLDDDEL